MLNNIPAQSISIQRPKKLRVLLFDNLGLSLINNYVAYKTWAISWDAVSSNTFPPQNTPAQTQIDLTDAAVFNCLEGIKYHEKPMNVLRVIF